MFDKAPIEVRIRYARRDESKRSLLTIQRDIINKMEKRNYRFFWASPTNYVNDAGTQREAYFSSQGSLQSCKSIGEDLEQIRGIQILKIESIVSLDKIDYPMPED